MIIPNGDSWPMLSMLCMGVKAGLFLCNLPADNGDSGVEGVVAGVSTLRGVKGADEVVLSWLVILDIEGLSWR